MFVYLSRKRKGFVLVHGVGRINETVWYRVERPYFENETLCNLTWEVIVESFIFFITELIWECIECRYDVTDGCVGFCSKCEQEGKTVIGIEFTIYVNFQEQFDFETLIDRYFTYIKEFVTSHLDGWPENRSEAEPRHGSNSYCFTLE